MKQNFIQAALIFFTSKGDSTNMQIISDEKINEFKKFLNEHNFFYVIAHKDPDGDAIYSCLGIKGLLEAKKLFREILDAEKKYSVEMPDVYCHLSEVGALMDPKLKEAAHDWSEQAYMEASVLQDTSMACKSYQMSLSLFDDASVRLESQMCGCE